MTRCLWWKHNVRFFSEKVFLTKILTCSCYTYMVCVCVCVRVYRKVIVYTNLLGQIHLFPISLWLAWTDWAHTSIIGRVLCTSSSHCFSRINKRDRNNEQITTAGLRCGVYEGSCFCILGVRRVCVCVCECVHLCKNQQPPKAAPFILIVPERFRIQSTFRREVDNRWNNMINTSYPPGQFTSFFER